MAHHLKPSIWFSKTLTPAQLSFILTPLIHPQALQPQRLMFWSLTWSTGLIWCAWPLASDLHAMNWMCHVHSLCTDKWWIWLPSYPSALLPTELWDMVLLHYLPLLQLFSLLLCDSTSLFWPIMVRFHMCAASAPIACHILHIKRILSELAHHSEGSATPFNTMCTDLASLRPIVTSLFIYVNYS